MGEEGWVVFIGEDGQDDDEHISVSGSVKREFPPKC